MWDEEVDVVCTGSGIAGLAHAVAVVDMGGEVFVAGSRGDSEPAGSSVAVRSRVDRLHWLEVDVPDPETNEYFAALSSDRDRRNACSASLARLDQASFTCSSRRP